MNPKTLLVVDDVPEILAFFQRLADTLRARPIEVTTVSDPAKALELVKSRPYDVVVTDFRMPLVNGVEILAAACARNPTGRRVLMTGYNEIPITDAQMLAADVHAHLSKPMKASHLMEFLQACFADDPHALDRYVHGRGEA